MGGMLYDSGKYIEKQSGATIRVRGNTSASKVEKKPYKLKLQAKADLLFRGNDRFQDKDWLLIKNWGIHGFLGFKLNERLGLPYAIQFKYVNVILNGNYKGTYMLCESVKRNTKCRINVSNTGCIFECDAYWWKEDLYVKSAYNIPMHYTFKFPDPEEITTDFIESFTDYIGIVESSMKTDDFSKYIDLDSFILWVIGQDILGNYDAAGSNIFLSKYDDFSDTKIVMPCLWDYDGIMGSKVSLPNVFASVHNFFYFQDLFCHPQFVDLYIKKYRELSSSIFLDMTNLIKDFAASDYGKSYKQSFEKDRSMWDFYIRLKLDKSFDEWINTTLDWLETRKGTLDAAVSALQINANIHSNDLKTKSVPIKFNLSGQSVSSPKKGIYIIGRKKVVFN